MLYSEYVRFGKPALSGSFGFVLSVGHIDLIAHFVLPLI